MKLTTGILGCALVAGLMAFAPSSQAGVIGTDGNLYSAISLKLTISYPNDKDKTVKKTITSKQVLKDLGYSSDVVLALGLNQDVVVINKKSGAIISNLSSNGVMSVYPDEYFSSEKANGNKGGFTDTSSGTIEIVLDSEDFFDVTGVYSGTLKGSSIDKNGDQKISTKASATSLSGEAFVPSLFDGDVVATGSASVKGDGKIPVAE